MLDRLILRWIARAEQRAPDFIIGGKADPYLERWWVIPRNRVFNIYLHHFLRDDDDRALHDHPWIWCSILLIGGYKEHTIAAGGVHKVRHRFAPSIRFASPWRAHRIELYRPHEFGLPGEKPISCWTLFITGPVVRKWGFHCPQGWRRWEDFVSRDDAGSIGRGCD